MKSCYGAHPEASPKSCQMSVKYNQDLAFPIICQFSIVKVTYQIYHGV